MKRFLRIALLLCMFLACMAACTSVPPQGTDPSATTTQAKGDAAVDPSETLKTLHHIPLSEYVLYDETKDSDSRYLLSCLQEEILRQTGETVSVQAKLTELTPYVISLSIEDTEDMLAPNTAEIRVTENGLRLCASDRYSGSVICQYFFTYLAEGQTEDATVTLHRMNNIRYKLEVEKKLTVLFAGSSTVEGAGVADRANDTLAGLFRDRLRADYPDAEIKVVNVGVGGTSTAYGMYQMENFLRIHKPDLVYLEYGSNDETHEFSREITELHLQGMIEKIYDYDPEIQIMLSTALRRDTAPKVFGTAGKDLLYREASYALAEHYGIPLFDWGIHFARYVRDTEGKTWDNLTNNADGVHTNEEGYRINADHMYPIFRAMIEDGAPELAPVAQPEDPYLSYSVLYAETVAVTAADFDSSFQNQGFLTSDTVGAKLSFDFSGTGVGVAWNIRHDGADVAYRVKDENGTVVSEGKASAANGLCFQKKADGSWQYASGRDTHRYFANGLPYGDYTLELEILESSYTYQQNTADGHALRIRQFLVIDGK